MTSTTTTPTTTTWTVDPMHAEVGFAVKHLMISTVRGRFGAVEGTVVVNEADPSQSRIDVTIDVTSIDTRQEMRDNHLRSADFFDAAKYPQATFRSTSVKALGEGRLEVTGTLDLHGVQKPVVLEVKLNKAAPHAMGKRETIGFDATATIRRSDFGINLYVPNVSDEVALRITTEASVAANAK